MPETLEKSLLSKISGIFFQVDLTGVEPVSKNQSPVLLRAYLMISAIRMDNTFPLPGLHKHSSGFSSFIIRLQVQSFACIVSYIVEAWVLKCRYSRSDCSQ